MPYVSRNKKGEIEEVYSEAQKGAEELLADDHPEVLAYMAKLQSNPPPEPKTGKK